MSKPFLKWAGGKAQLLQQIYKHIPENFGTYFEPFMGAGAVFFSLKPEKAVLNDVNCDLMNTYRVVKSNLNGVIELLQTYENDEKFFLSMREKMPMELSSLEAAARFIYLNRTAFNGLYRVNSKNKYNVPFGHYKKPTICDVQALTLASKALKSAEIMSTDFEKVLSTAEEGDFVYLDPPYIKVNQSSFVGYSKKGFNDKDHERLADLFKTLMEKKVKCLLSNADTPYTRELYSEFEVISVEARRNINSNGKGRGKVGEVLVRNY